MNRRTFLKIVGMSSISMAAGCTPDPYNQPRPDKTLYSLVHAPDDMVTGDAAWYASTCRECPAGCGILAKNREGRVIKVEGNPLHPINQGKLCMRGQAAVQGLFNPDRINKPLLKENGGWRSISFEEAGELLKTKAEAAAGAGPNRVRMLSEVVGTSLEKLFKESLQSWKSDGPLFYEPFAYESLKAANEAVFNVKGLPSYRMEDADVLIGFGADFLETWLSPVEYARKFKSMHALRDERKGLFYHIGPHMALTAANADFWLACRPGSEAVLALGLIGETLRSGRFNDSTTSLRAELESATAPYTKARVVELTGVGVEIYERLVTALGEAKNPLVLGTGAAAAGPNALQTDLAVNYLNWILNPQLPLHDFGQRHRVEIAATRAEVLEFFEILDREPVDLLLLNNVNPVYTNPTTGDIERILQKDALFVVSFSNFMDETTAMADLVLPVGLPLEAWDEYGGKLGMVSTLQPAMGKFRNRVLIGDVFLRAAVDKNSSEDSYKAYLIADLISKRRIKKEMEWLQTLQNGGIFKTTDEQEIPLPFSGPTALNPAAMSKVHQPVVDELTCIAAPSIRFFDGRSANRPWLCEVPDPITRVAWQTPVLVNPRTLASEGLKQGDLVQIVSSWGQVEAPVYDTMSVAPGVLTMGTGQGHKDFGRYAAGKGANPFRLTPPEPVEDTGGPQFLVTGVQIKKTGRSMKLAHTDGSRSAHDRKIAVTVPFDDLDNLKKGRKAGLTMWDFPLTLPLPEGYDPKRDFYPPHDHNGYRWSMIVDLDRCIGCGACAAACYAENNIGIVYEERILQGREMAWLSVERYEEARHPERITFLPLMCQHCDNAPCESVCPVYAPHHNKEGMNNQIYNRCIGTRFCSQNCPYKVRRFNWFTWEWPEPLQYQLNPNVTVRSKGVMEKCSFCIQRIKEAHGWAKNEKRGIRDGEIVPACVQTCPTDALVFGSLMDPNSRVRKMVDDPRAYQIMGYLNTKPGVIYLKKVVQKV
jgi:anaerobic selenocysteine-containing dehydrogenase/Fe-S-cluster-containing dehydrogenase component